MRFPSPLICQLLTAVLVLISHLGTEVTAGDQHRVLWLIVGKFVVITALAGLATFFVRRRQLPAGSLTTLLALAGMVGVFLIEPMWRQVFGVGHPLEIQLLIGLRNVSLICLIWSHLPRFENLAALTSLFGLLFCVSASEDQSLIWISGAYLVVGVSWLALRYWFSLNTESIRNQRRITPRWLAVITCLLLGIGLMLTTSPVQTRLRMARGMMSSSGGTGTADPFARSGVGDGDAVVAATREARSFAPIEDAPFLEDDRPSLYDMFQDTYGTPKKIEKFERAISIPPELFNHNHQRMAVAKKASKSFSIDRNTPQNRSNKSLKDTESNAILHLTGPVPVHLRHTVYDLFDGFEWYPEQLQDGHRRKFDVEQIDHKPWIRWTNYGGLSEQKWYDSHLLRIVSVDTNRILAPANLQGLHIDRCDRPDLFRWAQPDVIEMDRTSLPALTVIHLVSELVDTRQLVQQDAKLSYGFSEYRSLPVGPRMEEVKKLAQDWTRGAATDWEKVCAIRERLQTDYFHDPQLTIPENCENPLAWFLFDSRRGPDYLFSTAAVSLCRAAGISARGVSGFYADPENFDFATQQTSVYASDTHWWAEVYLGRQEWVTLDATPGYQVREVPLTIFAKLLQAISSGYKTAAKYWPVTLTAVACLGLMFYQRQRIIVKFRYWLWRMWFWTGPQTIPQWRYLLRSTGRLWDQQLFVSGQPRPAFLSPAQYLKQNEQIANAVGDREQLARAFDWAFYSEQTTLPREWQVEQLQQDCRSLVAYADRRPTRNGTTFAQQYGRGI